MVDVPVNEQTPSVVVVVASDGQTVFDYNFRVDKVGDLMAEYRYADGSTLPLEGGVDFTVSGLGTANGGTITLVSFTDTVTDDELAIYRQIPIERQTDYTRDLFANDLNAEQDRIFMIMQELNRDVGRAFRVPIGFSGSTPVPQDNMVLGWQGDQLINVDPAEFINDAGFATAAQGLLAEAASQKIFYAAQYGLHPGADMGAGFDAFLQLAWNNGARADFAVGTYLVSQKGKIRALAQIHGRGNAGVDGVRGGTVFQGTAALRASGDALLETDNFAVNSGNRIKLVTDPTMTWGFDLRGFAIDRGWSKHWDDRTLDVLKGRGLNIYGRRYKARDIGIYNCEGVGFYTEQGEPLAPPALWYQDYRNNQDGVIEDIDILYTAYENFVTFGPGDSYVNRITGGLVGDPNATVHPIGTPLDSLMFPGDRITNGVASASDVNGSSGTHEWGVIHFHTNWNGWNFRALGDATRTVRLKVENLTAEGGLGSVFIQGGVSAQLSKVRTGNNHVVDTTASGQFASVRLGGNFEIDIGSIEGRRKAPNTTDPSTAFLRIDQDSVQISRVKLQGNGQPGHAVTVEANRKDIYIGSINARNCQGIAEDGVASASFYSKAGSTEVTVENLMSDLSDYGWLNASTGRVAVKSGHARVAAANGNVAGIQLNATPANQYIRQSKLTSTTLAGALLKPDCNNIVTAATAGIANPSIVQSNVPLTIAHGMWRTPDYQREGRASVQFNVTKPTTPPNIEPTGADATNMTFNYNQPAAAAGASNTGTVVRLEI